MGILSQQDFTMSEEYRTKHITELLALWKKRSSLKEYNSNMNLTTTMYGMTNLFRCNCNRLVSETTYRVWASSTKLCPPLLSSCLLSVLLTRASSGLLFSVSLMLSFCSSLALFSSHALRYAQLYFSYAQPTLGRFTVFQPSSPSWGTRLNNMMS